LLRARLGKGPGINGSFSSHVGEIDCYRCLLLLALHPARHAAQIEEIKLDQGFRKVN
jgi:hypothetical protein